MNLPNKKYDLLVIDPPWNVKKLTHKARPNQIKFDYPTMSIDEIKAIDLQSVAKDKCWLFLWTTQKFLFQSKEVLEHWGFKHLTTGDGGFITLPNEELYDRCKLLRWYGIDRDKRNYKGKDLRLENDIVIKKDIIKIIKKLIF